MIYILLLLALLPMAEAKKDPRCKALNELNENLVNPVGLKSYANANGLKSIEDMMCCLPESYRSNYVIAAESLAGQSSNFHSPRVLLFNNLEDRTGRGVRAKALTSVISINGGGPGVAQGESIEMMFNNPKSGEVEYFDLEFADKHVKLSEKNPALCTSCHGVDGVIGTGGAHPNFEPPFKWRRFVKGVSACAPEEKAYIKKVEKSIEDKFKANPRFACLNPKPDGVDPFNPNGVVPSFMIASFDNYLEDLNDRRTSKIVKSSADYQKYKFAIVGAQVCDGTRIGSSSVFNPSDWMPEDVLKKHDSTSFLQSKVVQATDLSALVNAEVEKIGTRNTQIFSKMKSEGNEIAAGKLRPFLHSQGADPCFKKPTVEDRFSGPATRDFAQMVNIPAIDRFSADTLLRSGQSHQRLSNLRYLFEGRGIEIGDWSMSAESRQYLRAPEKLVHYLLEKDNDLAPVAAEIRKAGFAPKPGETAPNLDFDAPKKFCARLKSMSLKAFGTGDGAAAAPPTRMEKRVVR